MLLHLRSASLFLCCSIGSSHAQLRKPSGLSTGSIKPGEELETAAVQTLPTSAGISRVLYDRTSPYPEYYQHLGTYCTDYDNNDLCKSTSLVSHPGLGTCEGADIATGYLNRHCQIDCVRERCSNDRRCKGFTKKTVKIYTLFGGSLRYTNYKLKSSVERGGTQGLKIFNTDFTCSEKIDSVPQYTHLRSGYCRNYDRNDLCKKNSLVSPLPGTCFGASTFNGYFPTYCQLDCVLERCRKDPECKGFTKYQRGNSLPKYKLKSSVIRGVSSSKKYSCFFKTHPCRNDKDCDSAMFCDPAQGQCATTWDFGDTACSKRPTPGRFVSSLIPENKLLDGKIDFSEILQSLYNEFSSYTGIAVLVADWNCRDPSNTNIATMAENSGVTSCENFDFLDETEVIVSGFEKDEVGFCVAVNIFTNTYAIAQADLATVSIGGVIDITVSTIGASISGDFALSSSNEMWDGNNKDIMDFSGHFIVKAEATAGFKLTKIVTVEIGAGLSLLVNADPEHDGIEDPFQDIEGLDVAIFIQAEVTPVFIIEINNDEIELDFGEAIAASIDIYAEKTGHGSRLLFAGQIGLSLDGFCDSIDLLAVVCDFFGASGNLSTNIQVYANDQSFGLSATLEGELQFGPDWPDEVKEFMDTVLPPIDFEFGLGIELEVSNDNLSVCVISGSFNMCLATCNGHDDCDKDYFCEPILKICLPKSENFKPAGCNGLVKDSDKMCLSGVCVNLACQPCRKINTNDRCEKNEHCAAWGAFNQRCISDKNNGDVCLLDDECKSGICGGLTCEPCRKINTNDNCGSHMHCGLHNTNHRCINDKDRGSMCTLDDECKSGKCDILGCVDCYRNGSGCSSSQYCDLGKCVAKLGFKHVCAEDRVCESGVCAVTCTTNSCKGHACPFGDDYGVSGRNKCCKIAKTCLWGHCVGGGTDKNNCC